MNSYLGGEICPICGKRFLMQDRKSYLYKLKKKKTEYFCSYTCVNKKKKMIENKNLLPSTTLEG